jgi:hypothetical protein
MIIHTSDGSYIYTGCKMKDTLKHGRYVSKEKHLQEDLDIHGQRMFRQSDWKSTRL